MNDLSGSGFNERAIDRSKRSPAGLRHSVNEFGVHGFQNPAGQSQVLILCVFMTIKNLVCAAVFCGTAMVAQDRPWKPLAFLIGTWDAKTEGASAAAATGAYSFRSELKDHVLARHSSSAGCKGPVDFDCDHSDILYIYQDAPAQAYQAIYFDNEGHTIHYDVSSPAPNTAIFLSSPSQPGPEYRLAYELKGSIMSGKFQMRLPGQTEFKSYLEWSGAKQK